MCLCSRRSRGIPASKDAPRLPPLAVGSGGRTNTAIRELGFVTAAARGGGRRKGQGDRTGLSIGLEAGKGLSGGSRPLLALTSGGAERTGILPDPACARNRVLGG